MMMLMTGDGVDEDTHAHGVAAGDAAPFTVGKPLMGKHLIDGQGLIAPQGSCYSLAQQP
jgi:hypothetical protein